ncbi:MAG: ABC transporter substrate-binding protein [Proteobacteria bacterium]|nr:ABC transporter substrate-binding protein [Pseudomonadota bacterium]
MMDFMSYRSLFGSLTAAMAFSAIMSLAPAAIAAPLSTTNANDFSEVAPIKEIASLLPPGTKSLNVAMNLSTPPNKFLAADGRTALGTNPDLARLMGRVLGVPVQFSNVAFDGIIPGLLSGQFDFSIASMGVTPERTKVLDMIDYAQWGSEAVSLKTSNVDVHNLCGLNVGAQLGSLQLAKLLPELSSECTGKGKKAINIVGLPSQQDALTQLTSGRLDAAFGDTPVMSYAVLKQPIFRVAGDEIRPLPITLSTKKGSSLTPALIAAMKHIVHLPQYREIFQVWGLPNAAIDQVKLY